MGAGALRAGGKAVYKIGSAVYSTVEAALTAVLNKTPGLRMALGKLVDKLSLAGDAIAQSALGRGVSQAEASLGKMEAKIGEKLRVRTQPVPSIPIPDGIAVQSQLPALLEARLQVEKGATIYRIGTVGRSHAAEAQFWAFEHPRTPGYAKRYGIPPQNVISPDFIEAAILKPNTPFITRIAPGVKDNPGGGIEIVLSPGGAQMKWFSYLGKIE